MASKAEAITTVSIRTNVSQSLKAQMTRLAVAAHNWAKKGQLGSSSVTEMGRHSGARI